MLTGDRLTLRPARGEDIPALVAILAEPEVRRWWGDHDPSAVRRELEEVPCWSVCRAGRVVGWLQVNEEDDERFPSVAFDIALGSGARGQRFGREALRLAVTHFAGRGHHRFTIDPAVGNGPAIRCYEAVGFRPVGVLRQYERTPDGTRRDGLLMDLLADELLPG